MYIYPCIHTGSSGGKDHTGGTEAHEDETQSRTQESMMKTQDSNDDNNSRENIQYTQETRNS